MATKVKELQEKIDELQEELDSSDAAQMAYYTALVRDCRAV